MFPEAAPASVSGAAVGRTWPGVSGAWMLDLGADAEIARAIQK